MPANTLESNVNEILVGYYGLGGTWRGFVDSKTAEDALSKRLKQIGLEKYQVQEQRAKVMAIAAIEWARKNKFGRKPVKAWWTAAPNALTRAIGREIDSTRNPTDTLFQFDTKQFLGVSAKSTQGKGDIGFKNPGVGTVEKSLHIDLSGIIKRHTDKFVKVHSLPESVSLRKQKIRSTKVLTQASDLAREKLLKEIADTVFGRLKSMPEQAVKNYIRSAWLNAKDTADPPYIKVTGHGNKPPFTASVEDPTKGSKLMNLMAGKLSLERIGNDSVGVLSSGKRILKMRAKFESQAMASTIKFSGDPWH